MTTIIRPASRLYPRALFCWYCSAALPGWLVVGYVNHFRAGAWYGALIIVGMGCLLAWMFGGLSALASREIEVSPFVPPEVERPQIEALLAQGGIRPDDIYVTENPRRLSRVPDRTEDYPIVGAVTAAGLSATETAILGLKWKVEHTQKLSSASRTILFILWMGLGYGLVAPFAAMKGWRGLSLLNLVNLGPVFVNAIMVSSSRDSVSCARLAGKMLNYGCPPEALLSVFAKIDYMQYGRHRPRGPVKPLRLRLPESSYLAYLVFGFFRLFKFPVRREDSEIMFQARPIPSVQLRCRVRNLKGEFGQRLRAVAQAAGISEDRLRQIVIAAVEDCEARLQVWNSRTT